MYTRSKSFNSSSSSTYPNVVVPLPPQQDVDDGAEDNEEEGFNWWPLVIIGGAALALFLILRDKDDDDDKDNKVDPKPNPPTAGWTPEGSCPTPGARGLTPADLPQECRSSSCESTGSCSGTSGALDGEDDIW